MSKNSLAWAHKPCFALARFLVRVVCVRRWPPRCARWLPQCVNKASSTDGQVVHLHGALLTSAPSDKHLRGHHASTPRERDRRPRRIGGGRRLLVYVVLVDGKWMSCLSGCRQQIPRRCETLPIFPCCFWFSFIGTASSTPWPPTTPILLKSIDCVYPYRPFPVLLTWLLYYTAILPHP
jgi:hypothetical protein